ncbi:MAG: cyclic nucleotide-binding domain-containing protein [Labilithrix sp.]|nr:cyclic nucleotide-binding domain-containing protein [Labilithrix sp.]MCW5813713.1 cyclic nucleotide-binding domain-containing protein [Labilithrix sp.]
MSDPGKRAVLRRVRAFADLSDADCDVVLGVLKARRGAPHDVLFREGDTGRSLMIVLDGDLVVRARSSAGADEVVARLGPGEVVGELAFIDAEPRSATVAAGDAPVTVLDFTREALAVLVRDTPRVASAILRNILADVARRLREAGNRLASGGPASERGPVSLGRATRTFSVEELRAVPAFASYAPEDLALLAHVAAFRAFAARDVLFRAGGAGESCFLLASGEVEVTRPGVALPIATLGPGSLVGQLALLDRAPRSATVTATTDTIALELRADAFANLLRASSPVALRFQWQVALAGVRQLREATRRLTQAAAIERSSSLNDLDARSVLDDWDDGSNTADAITLELAIDPRSRR